MVANCECMAKAGTLQAQRWMQGCKTKGKRNSTLATNVRIMGGKLNIVGLNSYDWYRATDAPSGAYFGMPLKTGVQVGDIMYVA